MEINTQNSSPVSKSIWIALGGLAIAFLALSVIDKAHNLSQSFNAKPQNTISMTAEGKLTATPDLAVVNIGVISNQTTAKAAQDDMATKANKITDFIKQQGIADADITTSNISLYPNYDYQAGTNKINGYVASESISVKVRGVDKSTEKIGTIIAGASDNGGNQIQGVSFSFDDPDNLRQQARLQAIDKAKQKAQELATATGLKLGKVVSISDGPISQPYPIPYATDAFSQKGGGVASVAPEVQTGSQDITADITLVFEVK